MKEKLLDFARTIATTQVYKVPYILNRLNIDRQLEMQTFDRFGIRERYRHINYEISDDSLENLEMIDTVIQHETAVGYSDHEGFGDGAIGLLGLRQLPSLNRIYIPASMKHLSFSRHPESATFLRMMKWFNITLIPVIQARDTHPYSTELRNKLNQELRLATKKAFAEPNNLFMITPEGTRSDKGRLRQAETGISQLVLPNDNGNAHVAFGMSIQFPHYSGTKRGRVVVTRPYRLPDVISPALHEFLTDPHGNGKKQRRLSSDIPMIILAQHEPEHLRGHYQDPEVLLDIHGFSMSDLNLDYFQTA